MAVSEVIITRTSGLVKDGPARPGWMREMSARTVEEHGTRNAPGRSFGLWHVPRNGNGFVSNHPRVDKAYWAMWTLSKIIAIPDCMSH